MRAIILDFWKFLGKNLYIMAAGLAFQTWLGGGMAPALFVIFSLLALREGLEWAGQRVVLGIVEALADHVKRTVSVSAEITVERKRAAPGGEG